MSLFDFVPSGICRKRPIWYLLHELKLLVPHCEVSAYKVPYNPYQNSGFCWEVSVSNRYGHFSRFYEPAELESLAAMDGGIEYEASDFIDEAWKLF